MIWWGGGGGDGAHPLRLPWVLASRKLSTLPPGPVAMVSRLSFFYPAGIDVVDVSGQKTMTYVEAVSSIGTESGTVDDDSPNSDGCDVCGRFTIGNPSGWDNEAALATRERLAALWPRLPLEVQRQIVAIAEESVADRERNR